jgi:hypothetical protein
VKGKQVAAKRKTDGNQDCRARPFRKEVPMKVKLFCGFCFYIDQLEAEINRWLDEHTDDLIDCIMQSIDARGIFIAVWYRPSIPEAEG